MTFQKLLRYFDGLNISKGEYVIFGSGPMAARGIKESNDLDILVLPEVFAKLRKKFPQDTSLHPFGCIEIGDLEIGDNWQGDIGVVKKMINDAEEYRGHMYSTLQDVIQWKKKMGRPKDIADIGLILKYQQKDDTLNNLILLFEEVRFLSYHLPESQSDTNNSCWTKNRILYAKLKEAGYSIRYGVCSFLWDKQKLPKEITSMVQKNIDFHLFVELEVGNSWITLDASNDPSLSPEKWDGKTSTKLAVIPKKIYSHSESKKREPLYGEHRNYNFNKKVNIFLDKIRNRKKY
jgi:hypothetical protein